MINRKKLQRTLGVLESTFLFYIIFCVNLAMSVLQAGGRIVLVLLPIFDAIHAERYWKQSEHVQDPLYKIFLNKLYYGAKVLTSAVGAGLAIGGGAVGNMFLLNAGFTVLIAMGTIGVARNILKIYLNWNNENPHKVENNAIKATIGILISLGFAFMTFVPTLTVIPGVSLTLGNLGGLLAAAAAAFIFIVSAPPALLNTPVKAKNQEEFAPHDLLVLSGNYVHDHVHRPLTFSNIYASVRQFDQVEEEVTFHHDEQETDDQNAGLIRRNRRPSRENQR